MTTMNLTMSLQSNGHQLISHGAAMVGPARDWDLGLTLYAYLEDWAERQPERIAAVDVEGEQISYREMLLRVRRRAARLREVAAAQRFVLSRRARSVECLIDIVACNAIGAIYVPVDPAWPASRLKHVTRTTDPAIILADDAEADVTYDPATHGELIRRVSDPVNAPAYCLFTSGSTGQPKGALVAQMGMLNHLHSKVELLDLDRDSVVAETAPTTFDVSVWQFAVALLVGGAVRVVHDDEAQDPFGLSDLLGRERITHVEVVPTVLRELIHAIPADVNLSALAGMMVTGEELPLRLAQDWGAKFEHIPLVNAYGPTECSDDVTHAEISEKTLASGTVPIGAPIANTALYVLRYSEDSWHSVSPGEQGELFVAGLCVGLGYVGEDEKTAGAFATVDGYPFRIYRTGDLVRVRADGLLVYEGRSDRQVKINGVRIEPGEIENRILRETAGLSAVSVVKYIPAVRERSAIVIRETNESFLRPGDARLVAFFSVADGSHVTSETLEMRARDMLPAPMRPSRWLRVDELPLTASGKVDINRLESLAVELGGGDEALERTALIDRHRPDGEPARTSFFSLVESVLGHVVDSTSSFVEAGGDSLRAIQLSSRLRAQGKSVRVADLLSGRPLEEVERDLASKRDDPVADSTIESRVMSASTDDRLPATCPMKPAQMGIYFQWLLEPESAYYNYQVLLESRGGLDVPKTRQALFSALHANPQLFARFEVAESGEFIQVFPSTGDILQTADVEYVSSRADARARSKELAAQPFDLENEPSLRVHELRVETGETWFVVTMNEILIDGWGTMKLAEFISELYDVDGADTAAELARANLSAVARYFNSPVVDVEMSEESRTFWSKSLSGISVEPLLSDIDDASHEAYSSSIVEASLGHDTTVDIRTNASALSTTPFAVFVLAYSLALATVTERDDFVVGAPVSRRELHTLVDVPTLTLNMVAMRILIDRGRPCHEVARELSSSVTRAVSFSDSPFSSVVSEYAEHTNGDPLFGTMVNMLTYPTSESWKGTESIRFIELDTGFTKYDGSLYVQQHGEDYTIQLAFKQANVSQQRARQILALTAWYLRSDLRSSSVRVGELMRRAMHDLDLSGIRVVESVDTREKVG